MMRTLADGVIQILAYSLSLYLCFSPINGKNVRVHRGEIVTWVGGSSLLEELALSDLIS